jgi:phosphate transport system permease protein
VKRFIEKFIEALLLISGSVTSITILLIVLFLFKEASGLFNTLTIEEGYVLAVNKSNPVRHLSSLEIKQIFDSEITNWDEVGGKEEAIQIVRLNDLTQNYVDSALESTNEQSTLFVNELLEKHSGILLYLPKEYVSTHFSGALIDQENIQAGDFFGGQEWYPTATPAPQFGLLPLLLGTFWVSIGAVLLALPFGLAVGIYLAEIASPNLRRFIKPLIELLAGIPTVVFGFFGLVVIVPLIREMFHLPVGETGLAGSVVLGIMALPTIITISEDAIRKVPFATKEASLALGATHWQTIYRVILPYAKSGIITATVLGIGRAVGETIAVLMVTGNAAVIPHSLLEPMRAIPATIATELGVVAQGSAHYQALFALGVVLFVVTMILSAIVEYFSSKSK